MLASYPVRSSGAGPGPDVLTYHTDNARTGQNLNEAILSPGNVNTNHFGKLWVLNTDDRVDAQPLYAAGVSIPLKGARNVLFVATEHDSVYAFDADSTNLFWHVSVLGTNETPSDNRSCSQVPDMADGQGAIRQLAVGPGKDGNLYLVDRSDLGEFNGTNDSAIYEELDAALPGGICQSARCGLGQTPLRGGAFAPDRELSQLAALRQTRPGQTGSG